jgi:outer membrane protein
VCKPQVASTLALLALVAVDLAAQTAPDRLTLEDCIQRALASHPTLAMARAQTDIADLGVRQAKAAFLPQARLNGAFAYNTPSSQGPDLPTYVALNGAREYLALATASVELDTSGRLRAARSKAEADLSVARAGAGIAERDLKRQVVGAYYRTLLAEHLAAAARDALAESTAFEARVKLLFGDGEAARADVVKASAQTAFLDQAVTAADLDLEMARHELLAFWTSDVASPVELADVLEESPPEPPPLPPSQAPFLSRPEFALFDAQRDGFLAASRRARDDRRPQLGAAFQYGFDTLHFDDRERGWAAFVTLDVPVFDWSAGKNAARQLELQADQVDTTRRGAERLYSKEYQDAASRVRSLHAQIESTRAQRSLSEENLRLSRIRYEGGEGPALDVFAAQTQLAQARTNLYTTLARYLESRADLELAAGR